MRGYESEVERKYPAVDAVGLRAAQWVKGRYREREREREWS